MQDPVRVSFVTEDEEAREKEFAEVEKFLGECSGPGYQVVIERKAPRWCSGYLDTWMLDEPLSLQEIRDAFGGQRFFLRILRGDGSYLKGLTVRIDAPPKRNGMEIRIQDQPPMEDTRRASPAKDDGQAAVFREMLAMMRHSQDQTMNLLAASQKAKQLPAPASGPLDSIKQITEAIGLLKGAALELGGGEATDPNTHVMLKFFEMVEKRMTAQAEARAANPQQTQQPPQGRPARPNHPPGPVAFRGAPPVSPGTPRTAPPPQASGQSPAPQPTDQSPAPPPFQVAPEPETPEDEVPLDDELIECGPETTGEAFASALLRWTPEEAHRAVMQIMGPDVPLDMIFALRKALGDGGEAPLPSDPNDSPKPEGSA